MTKKNWRRTGYLIPENIDPDENICVCVPIPKDWGHINAFIGQLTELAKWLTWEKDNTDNASIAARRWMEITECVIKEINCIMTTGCGCGDDGSFERQERFTADGDLEVSFDGGATWEDGSKYDARDNVIIFPPRPEGETDGQCLAAENATYFFKTMVDTILAQLAAGGGAAGAAPAVIALLITIGFPTGLGAVLALVYGLISAVIGLVTAGLEGTFDSTFYDDLRCYFFCVIDSDGTLTDADITSIYNDLVDRFGGTNPAALAVCVNILETVGSKGFTNAARGDSVPTSDCSDCECPTLCAEKYQIYQLDPAYGEILEYGENYIIAACGASGYLTLEAIDFNDCCFVNSMEILSGVGGGTAFEPCGAEPSPPWVAATAVGQCASIIECQFSVVGTMKIFLDECP